MGADQAAALDDGSAGSERDGAASVGMVGDAQDSSEAAHYCVQEAGCGCDAEVNPVFASLWSVLFGSLGGRFDVACLNLRGGARHWSLW